MFIIVSVSFLLIYFIFFHFLGPSFLFIDGKCKEIPFLAQIEVMNYLATDSFLNLALLFQPVCYMSLAFNILFPFYFLPSSHHFHALPTFLGDYNINRPRH